MRQAKWAAIILALTLGGFAAAQESGLRAEDIERQYRAAKPSYDKAVKLFAKQDALGVQRELEAAISAFPAYSEAHFLLAKSHYLSRWYAEALPPMERAEAAWNDFAGLIADARSSQWAAQATRRRALQDQIAALQEDLSRSTVPRPGTVAAPEQDRARIQNYISQLQHEIQEIDRGQSAPQQGSASMPAEYSFVHGNILLRMNRLDQAEQQYLRAIAANPKYGEAFNNLASLYYQAGRFEEARQVMQQARSRRLPVNADLERAVAAQP
jgi:pentatricopeptide repeat protein